MARYRKRPEVIEAITFPEFLKYARNNSPAPHWSVEYGGVLLTHETDSRYTVQTGSGECSFTPQDMLVTETNGRVHPVNLEMFDDIYYQI